MGDKDPRPQGAHPGVNSFLAPLPRTPSPGEGPASKWPVEAAGAVDGEPRSSAPKRRPPLLGRRQRTPAPTATTGRASRTQNSRYAPSSQLLRISSIGLHPVPRLHGDQSRCDHVTAHPKFAQLPVQAVAVRSRLVAGTKSTRWPQLLHQPSHRVLAVGDGSQRPHFTSRLRYPTAIFSESISRPRYRLFFIGRLLSL